jgi:penicillin-binding protein 2
MLVVDELKKNEPQLRLVAVVLAAGLCILLAGLWWVQVVSAREYQSHLETQSHFTVRVPAMRGKILDREGRVLAENQPRYNLTLYLDTLSDQFKEEYLRIRPMKVTVKPAPFWKFWSREKTLQTNRVRLAAAQIDALSWQARLNVAHRVAAEVGRQMGLALTFDDANFKRHYKTRRAMPFPVLENLTPELIARFEERVTNNVCAHLDLQAVRNYPAGDTAAHLLGYLRRDNDSQEGEEASFDYRLPDYSGVLGVEYGYDNELRGRAGMASVLVNNLGYRVMDNIWSQAEPGQNLVLTLDLDLQRAAENSLLKNLGANARAAAVVLDVRNGDVLVMASSPTYDPNDFAGGISQEKWDAIQKLKAEKNRATAENYAPGSIFKVVGGLAALEAGLNPNKTYAVEPDPSRPGRGCIYVSRGRRKIEDTAKPGDYTFKRAIECSSNSYFIQLGLQYGIEGIIELAEKFHFGENTGLRTRQETPGGMPTLARLRQGWGEGDTANVCIGQGEVAVTPLQMAVAYSAIANGGKIFWPRLVMRVEPQDRLAGATATNFPAAMLRDQLGVSGRSLRILHDAMLGETEDAEGTGKAACVPGIRICGKTGTAQVPASSFRAKGWNYWFASFAPYESPRYAVVVLVESESPGSGGGVAAPIAHDIYQAIVQKEAGEPVKTLAKR